MTVQGIGGGAVAASFRQLNLQTSRVGGQVTAEKMYNSHPHNSVSGNDTDLGTSHFQKENDELISTSVERISSIMEKDDDVVEVSNTGSETNFSSSDFQQVNDRSYNARQQVAASAYNYFNE